MHTPITRTTPYGDVTLNSKFHLYEGNLTFGESVINVLLDVGAEGSEIPFAVLGEVGERMAAFDRECREYAADELLEGANDWLGDSDDEDKPAEYTREMFMELMALECIVIGPDGAIQMGYADGDMFWGHTIMVDVDADGVITYADIAG